MRRTKYTKNILEPLVQESTSIQQVIKKLGLRITGGNQTNIKDKIALFGIDTNHFTGQGWSKGKTRKTSESVNTQAKKITLSDEQIFCNPSHVSKAAVRRRFLSVSEYLCSECNLLPHWNGRPLTLHLDHINGNRLDNTKQNLRWLCPNCHQQTSTWGNNKNTQS